jgi:hypothetical protein
MSAVSEPEKNAERISSTTSRLTRLASGISSPISAPASVQKLFQDYTYAEVRYAQQKETAQVQLDGTFAAPASEKSTSEQGAKYE